MPPNILQLQREVESLSDGRLLQEAQMPNMFPAYLTQQEMVRREQERNAYQARKAQQPTNTVHDRLIERAMSGIGSLPQQLSPEQEMFARQSMMDMSPEQMMQQQMMMQSPMPQPMADGGLVGYQDGGDVDPDPDPPYTYSPYLGFSVPISEWLSSFNRWLKEKESSFDTDYGAMASYAMQRGTTLPRLTRPPFEPAAEADVAEVDPWSLIDQQIAEAEGVVPRIVGPSSTPSVAEDENEGIASLVASMQAPAVQRQELDLSQYFQMTPEEQAVIDRARADAQSLESRIDTEADRLSARANILSSVARAMARGQVPTISEPLRELQTQQRGRREGIMDESRAMEMAALAQGAGLSRAEQEALMERAIIGEERDYQERLLEGDRQRFNQYVAMTQSDDPDVQAVGRYNLQKMGVTSRGELTQNAAAQINARAINDIDEFVQQIDTEDIASALRQINTRLAVIYGGQPVPADVIQLAMDALRREAPEEYDAYMATNLPASGS